MSLARLLSSLGQAHTGERFGRRGRSNCERVYIGAAIYFGRQHPGRCCSCWLGRAALTTASFARRPNRSIAKPSRKQYHALSMRPERSSQLIHVRLPASLHAQVRSVAEVEGVNLNTFLVTLIARGTAEFAIRPDDGGVLPDSKAKPSPGRISTNRGQALTHFIQTEPRTIYVNRRTLAAHDASCNWLDGAVHGSRPIDLDGNYLVFGPGDALPKGTHGVSCCSPDLPAGFVRSSGRKRRSG